jgi:hypothetical protein
MPTEQVTLSPGAITPIVLDRPAGRIVITMESGTPAEVYGTADTSTPVIPGNEVEVPGTQFMVSAFISDRIVIQPPLYGDHMVIPTVNLLSAGSPTVSVQW